MCGAFAGPCPAIRLMPPPPSPTGTAAGALHLPGTTTTMYAIANPWSWPASFTVEARLFVRSGSSDPHWLSYASPGNSNCFVSRAPGTLHQWLTVHITYSGGTTRYVCGTAGRASRTPLQPMPPSTPPPQRPHALFGHFGTRRATSVRPGNWFPVGIGPVSRANSVIPAPRTTGTQ